MALTRVFTVRATHRRLHKVGGARRLRMMHRGVALNRPSMGRPDQPHAGGGGGGGTLT